MWKPMALVAGLLCTGMTLGQTTEPAGQSPNAAAPVAQCASQAKYDQARSARSAWPGFTTTVAFSKLMLAQDVTLQGQSFKKGAVIGLGLDGKVDLNAKKLSEW